MLVPSALFVATTNTGPVSLPSSTCAADETSSRWVKREDGSLGFAQGRDRVGHGKPAAISATPSAPCAAGNGLRIG
ncbi:MAG: hypothetical protein PHE55_08310 [Methylococcaceae bacterium]|nr:hypothetical protein [Methylococcaceae bacterium]